MHLCVKGAIRSPDCSSLVAFACSVFSQPKCILVAKSKKTVQERDRKVQFKRASFGRGVLTTENFFKNLGCEHANAPINSVFNSLSSMIWLSAFTLTPLIADNALNSEPCF